MTGDRRLPARMYGNNCQFCSGTVQPKKVALEGLKHKEGFILLEDVTIGVCDTCGNRYYTADILHAVHDLATGENKAGTDRRSACSAHDLAGAGPLTARAPWPRPLEEATGLYGLPEPEWEVWMDSTRLLARYAVEEAVADRPLPSGSAWLHQVA